MNVDAYGREQTLQQPLHVSMPSPSTAPSAPLPSTDSGEPRTVDQLKKAIADLQQQQDQAPKSDSDPLHKAQYDERKCQIAYYQSRLQDDLAHGGLTRVDASPATTAAFDALNEAHDKRMAADPSAVHDMQHHPELQFVSESDYRSLWNHELTVDQARTQIHVAQTAVSAAEKKVSELTGAGGDASQLKAANDALKQAKLNEKIAAAGIDVAAGQKDVAFAQVRVNTTQKLLDELNAVPERDKKYSRIAQAEFVLDNEKQQVSRANTDVQHKQSIFNELTAEAAVALRNDNLPASRSSDSHERAAITTNDGKVFEQRQPDAAYLGFPSVSGVNSQDAALASFRALGGNEASV